MKRLLALIIIAVTILPLFAFPIGAEEKHEIVLYENGQYKIDFTLNDSEEDNNFFINLLVSHTGTPYDETLVNTQEAIYIVTGKLKEEFNNKITYTQSNGNNIISVGYDSSRYRDYLFDKLTQKIQSMPTDRIALDTSFFNVNTDNKDENRNDNEAGFFETAGKVFKAIFNLFDIFEVDNKNSGTTITSGGFNLIQSDSQLNKTISKIYTVMYPIGFAVMLLCWGFGAAKSTISSSLDIKDKSSIIYSFIALIIGISAMSLAPRILTVLTGASRWLCEKVGSAASLVSPEYFGETNLLDMIVNGAENGVTVFIIFAVIDLIFILNILWIALLQCLSPIFIGLMANQGTRKISFNFIKEYFKALLVPVLTVCYFGLVNAFQLGLNNYDSSTSGGMVTGFLGSIVLAISTLSIAGKKLDKLIN